jgi:hypothetical protein
MKSHLDQPVYRNSENKMPHQLTKALAARDKVHHELLALQNQNDLTPDQRKKLSDLRKTAFRELSEPLGISVDRLAASFNDIATFKYTNIGDHIKRRTDKLKQILQVKPGDLKFPKPASPDHSFFFAETQPFVTADMTGQFDAKGLHFTGGPKVNDYDGVLNASFGARVRFTLEPERLPTSVIGTFISSPHVELFGGIVAFAPDWDLIQGDGIASCNLVLKQTVFQFRFGETGPVEWIVGQNTIGSDGKLWNVSLKNTGSSRSLALPGFQEMPSVKFHSSDFHPNEVLFADLDIRFDIQLKAEGALAWCDPEVLLRVFQWPLLPSLLP